MRALVLEKYGGPDTVTLRDFPEPSPRAGEVQIEVHCAGLNPVDSKIREKKVWPIVRLSLPVVMGNECAGVVRTVGAGVTRFAPGDRVFTRVAKSTLAACGEVACVPEALVAKLPAKMSMREGAALPLVGLTALQALFEVGQLKQGQRVFIQAGAGGVGTIAIQLAKEAGAHVITTASSAGTELVRRLGADEVVDYKTVRWQDVVKDVDLVLESVGGDGLFDAFGAVKKGGTVVSIAGAPTLEMARQNGVPMIFFPVFWAMGRKAHATAAQHSVSYHYLFMRPGGAGLAQLGERVERGTLQVIIDKVFPFDDALAALAYLETGRAKGKVVLELRPAQT